MMSFWRAITSWMSRGSIPRALNRSTWKTRVLMRSSCSSRCCSGVLETMPPSQKWSVPILTIGSAGGRAPLAITCSGVIVSMVLSK